MNPAASALSYHLGPRNNMAVDNNWFRRLIEEKRVLGIEIYLDPQDPLFFDEPSKPVVVYSHVITGTKVI